MFDGNNLFNDCTSFFHHEWKIDETLTKLIGNGTVEPLIVVGIDAPDHRRGDEYLPYPDMVLSDTANPHGKDMPKFLVGEVLPLIAKQFRVRSGPANTAIGGSSYGSIAALYALITRPDVFGLGLLESTSLHIGNGELLRQTTSLARGPLRVYVGVGTNELADSEKFLKDRGLDTEPTNAGFAQMSETLAANLKKAQFNRPEVLFVSQPGARHEEPAWAARFPGAIQFLFPAQPSH